MLYSPILSLLRFLVFIPWVAVMASMHAFTKLFSKRFFFIFYRLLFMGAIKIFGIKVNIFGKATKKNVLFISNHISYLDIFVLGSSINAIFIAKSEIRDWPLINNLAAIGKTIFVERTNKNTVLSQMKIIEENMIDGFNVILFPEGTSSDGSKVLDFKSSLFEIVNAKGLANYHVQPISISYSKLDGLPLDKIFRPFLAWFGGMDLISHAWKFLGLGLSEVNLHFHDSKKFSSFLDRKHACRFCYEKISNQVINNYRSLEIDDKIKLYEFKFL